MKSCFLWSFTACLVATTRTWAFQPSCLSAERQSATASSRRLNDENAVGAQPSSSSSASSSSSFSALNAFGGGGFGATNTNYNLTPIGNRHEALQRLLSVLAATWQQFVSGCLTGYVLGSAWGLLRGPSAVVPNRGLAWGLDFGILSALFAGTQGLTQFVVALRSNKKQGKTVDNTKQTMLKQQAATLWSAVVRNMLLALYFGRHGGALKMIRSAAFYGGLTYYFVSKKHKRDLSARGNSSTTFGTTTKTFNQQDMQQLFQQILANQSSSPGTTTSASAASSSFKASKSTNKRPNQATKPGNAVDVEWEKVADDADKDEAGT